MVQRVSSWVVDGSQGSAPRSRVEAARERAIAFLLQSGFPDRRAGDSSRVGLQALLASGPGPDDGLDLQAMAPSMGAADASAMAEDLRLVLSFVESKLGFPLEPETFSNMVFGAYLGDDRDGRVRHLASELTRIFAPLEADGQYHFFQSLRFACDTDCTGVAARALLRTGVLDRNVREGAAWLRRITGALLRSACVADVPASENATHGKDNGSLERLVLKVYWDDHRVQDAACDRGLKINPVVVANALFPVLFELRAGLRDASEVVVLTEFVEGSTEPRSGEATVAEIVDANVAYLGRHLATGEWRSGCRYYPSPDAFLAAYGELLAEFPERFGTAAIVAARDAIRERRRDLERESTDLGSDPRTSLNLALRAIAAQALGVDPAPEQEALIALQSESGEFVDGGYLYSFGRASSVPIHFRSRAVTTALAARALDGARSTDLPDPIGLGIDAA